MFFLERVIVEERHCKLFCNSFIGSQFVGLKSKPNMSLQCKKRMVSMTNKKAPMTSGGCFSSQKQDLTSLAWIAMSWSGNEMRRFQMWVRKLVITVPNVQSSSVPCLVEVMRLTGMESMVDRLAALKMSWSFFPSFTRLCYVWCE